MNSSSPKEATLNLSKETGKFTDATILRKELSLHLEGKSIEKTGFDTYRIDDGWVITCKLNDGETPPWSFSSSNTEAKQGGYAVLKHATFNIRDVPIFYTPYMIIPIKDTRQSGLLYPYFSFSGNDGAGLNLPFFLNLSDSADFTFFPEYRSKRGFMPGGEFRYVSSETNKGMFTASFLDDKLSDPSETEYYQDTGYLHDNSQRYWIRGKANHTFWGMWQSRLDVDIVSDQDYLDEFSSGLTGFAKSQEQYLQTFGRGFENETDTQRQNSFKTLLRYHGMSLEGNLLAINDASTYASGSYTPLWKLPGIVFSGALPIAESQFSFDWNTTYVNYWREDGLGGQRVDLHPSISAPIPLGPYLETLAEVGLRDTFYSVQTFGDATWENDDTQNRFLMDVKLEVATTLERDFSTGDGELDGFTHQVRPFVKYAYIPTVDQTELPQFDSVDLISEKKTITYGVDNFFNTLASKGLNKGAVWDAASLRVEQSYDLRQDPSDDPFEPFSVVTAKLGLAPGKNTKIVYKTEYDVYDDNFPSHSFGGVYRNSRGDLFGLDYSYKEKRTFADEIDQINANLRTTIFNNWIAGAEIQHSLSLDETIKANGSITYKATCWAVSFETHYTPADTAFMLLFSLANIGSPLSIDL